MQQLLGNLSLSVMHDLTIQSLAFQTTAAGHFTKTETWIHMTYFHPCVHRNFLQMTVP